MSDNDSEPLSRERLTLSGEHPALVTAATQTDTRDTRNRGTQVAVETADATTQPELQIAPQDCVIVYESGLSMKISQKKKH